jgi:hypothetical protein
VVWTVASLHVVAFVVLCVTFSLYWYVTGLGAVAAAALSANDAPGGKHRKGSELKYEPHLSLCVSALCLSVWSAVWQILQEACIVMC